MPFAYRGRFAPSPTGPLHFGSLIAAMASFAEAQAHGAQWLVRMEDIDRPRTVPGAADHILRTLEILGFRWNGEVVYQSQREELYQGALDRLKQMGLIYACACSRRDLAEDGVYPGTCRLGLNGRPGRAWRVRVEGSVAFDDLVQGPRVEDLAKQTGDFVLLRADGAWAYQLAVVVDDAEQAITHVVRGADLLSSTARQVYLQRHLGYPVPVYLHVPVALDHTGQKLSKQTGAPPIDTITPGLALSQAAAFLGHPMPAQLHGCGVDEFWRWLTANWRHTRIPAVEQVRLD
jgi:glutamyl-Q tRNA(Asp) synthetase